MDKVTMVLVVVAVPVVVVVLLAVVDLHLGLNNQNSNEECKASKAIKLSQDTLLSRHLTFFLYNANYFL